MQKGQTKRVPWALGVRSTSTAHPGLQKRNSMGSITTAAGLATAFRAAGLATRDATVRLRVPAARRCAAVLAVRDAFTSALILDSPLPAAPGLSVLCNC